MASSRRGRNNYILPLAIGLTAAVASVGLYYWLGDSQHKDQHDDHGHQPPRPRRRSRNDVEHDRITEVDEEEIEREERERAQQEASTSSSSLRRRRSALGQKKSVAIVISEESMSLLRYLPTPFNLQTTNIFVLIYSPDMKIHPLAEGGRTPASAAYEQAKALFPREYPREFILPYTSPSSLVPLLRQLAPETVYLEGSLAGEDGSVVTGVLEGGWVGNVIVAVDTDGRGKSREEKWWEPARAKFGKNCRILSKEEVGDDWRRRIGARR
ncbi:hypothetical protein RUND412_003753 [Rhizina undulata]